MHIRTAVWIAVVCMALATASSIVSTFAAMPTQPPIPLGQWWEWIFNKLFLLLGHLGVLLFLVIFGIKGGRPPKSSRHRSEENGGNGGERWQRR